MNDFEIEVEGVIYKGELLTFGYSYRIELLVNDLPVIFEPDEERNFRAIVTTEPGIIEVNSSRTGMPPQMMWNCR